MRIDCVGCGRRIPAADVELTTLVARCTACDEVFSVAALIRGTGAGADLGVGASLGAGAHLGAGAGPAGETAEAPREGGSRGPRHAAVTALANPLATVASVPADPPALVPAGRPPPVPLPKGMRVERDGKRLEIRRSWFTWQVVPMALFALFWNGFMAVWFGVSIAKGLWPMALFGTLHGLVGLGMIYGVGTTLFNSTRVRVDGGRLAVSHGPLWSPGACEHPARAIDQLYCRRGDGKSKDGDGHSYEVWAVLADRRHVSLVTGIESSDQALFLERELEDHLGIEDRPVPGELSRPQLTVAVRRRTLPAGESILGLPPRRAGGGVRATDAAAATGEVRTAGVEVRAAADCPVCGDPTGLDPTRCPQCQTPHHPECWRYQGGCSMYGCAGGAG